MKKWVYSKWEIIINFKDRKGSKNVLSWRPFLEN